MILISYDISDDKLRNRFSKYIQRFGGRIQYSVYTIDNSDRILDNIVADIKNEFKPDFSERDSIIILKLSQTCEITRLGYAVHEASELEIV